MLLGFIKPHIYFHGPGLCRRDDEESMTQVDELATLSPSI